VTGDYYYSGIAGDLADELADAHADVDEHMCTDYELCAACFQCGGCCDCEGGPFVAEILIGEQP